MKKLITFIILIVLILIIIGGFSSINKFENYKEVGVKDVGNLVSGKEAWYNRYVFVELSTIVCNYEYGTFVFRKNGEFSYFPAENNILNNNNNEVYRYIGYWYYDFNKIRFTVTRTYFNRKLFNISFKDIEYFKSFGYVNSGEMAFNDNLVIGNQVFQLLDNELTKKSGEKLKLEETILNEYLEKYN